MSDVLAQLEPRAVWGHFTSILRIPRPSRREEEMVAWIRSLATIARIPSMFNTAVSPMLPGIPLVMGPL